MTNRVETGAALRKHAWRMVAAMVLTWAGLGNAVAQPDPGPALQIVRFSGNTQNTSGPSGGSGSTVACMNLGSQVVANVSCSPQFQMLASDGSIVARAPDSVGSCRVGRGTGYATNSTVVTAPFTLQPVGQDGDSVICSAFSQFGGQQGGADYPFTDARYHWTMGNANVSATFDSSWVPIYDAISDVITHTVGTSKSYDLMANDQAGRASPPGPLDPANPMAWRGGQICVWGPMATGYATDQTDPTQLTFHSSVFTGEVQLTTDPNSTDRPNRPYAATLPLGVVFNRNGMMTVPATLPPGNYDLFYHFVPNQWNKKPFPTGYADDGTFDMAGCESKGDYALVKLRVVAPVPVQVPTLEFGALVALGALVGAAGLRQRRRHFAERPFPQRD
ncbi:IPTL-CTERM sorting domain-containing protein [Ottowia sp. SB7-C50]|uniref:IPTL-CTERM sorting domain-containing protein n=1 Tax=Ottowia sp. SB7-C50 TaxID=3081231 RepID=UPI0029543183|nr:IPTL-CTERM sorting domain-containing protein [Ottowia sp. SB7-C50]WOP15041.1 IPTL-CTERM sorting domain-containing protein [Ottowia sp. SB7-C50]